MKRHIIPCILSLTLLLTACGGKNREPAAGNKLRPTPLRRQ